jgi:hypothetical protein
MTTDENDNEFDLDIQITETDAEHREPSFETGANTCFTCDTCYTCFTYEWYCSCHTCNC